MIWVQLSIKILIQIQIVNNISDRTKSQLEDNIEIDKKVLKRSEIYPHFFSR